MVSETRVLLRLPFIQRGHPRKSYFRDLGQQGDQQSV